jgi:DeoR/GlpR family transcriptional regulator of sugar metabolism
MIKEKRFEHILSSLKSEGMVTYNTMSSELFVSEDTIRRDIEYLHDNGLLTKVRGGAISKEKNPLTFQDRVNYQTDEKKAIALKVQGVLKTGMTVFMDGGTTICAIAEFFPANASFRIITNNMALIPILNSYRDIEVIVLGGNYDKNAQVNTGTKTCAEAEQFVADLYLMGTCAISIEYGVTATIREDVAVKQSMLKAAKKTAVISNSKKIGTTESFIVSDLSKIDILVTELQSDDKRLDLLRYQNIKII